GETRVIIRQIDLESDTLYRMEGNFTVTNFIDADLLLFRGGSSETGDPSLYAALTLGIAANESLIFNVPDDDTYYLVVKWVDGSYQGDCRFSIEPIIDIQSHNDGDILKSGTKITLDIDATSLTSLNYAWGITAPLVLNSPYEVYLPSGDGEQDLTIFMQDTFGNNAQISYTFITDDTKPTILLDGVSNNDEINAAQNISVNIVEAHLQGVVYHWDTSSDQAWVVPYTTTAPNSVGTHTLSVTATDVAGNQESVVFTFEILGSTDPTGNFMIPVSAVIISLFLVAVIQRKKK
ncbi:MAG: hypothetical protein KAJ72_07205, partial [Candidatus Heimdallarchaeota archaeon]|nr:hypothetical protein [Candidatus Heimdallarchaeota archaeon]